MLTKEQGLSLYRENLKIVLSHVDGMLKQLPGVSVITGDHGNLFGERLGILYPFPVYGHWPGMRLGRLVLVPWLVTANGEKIMAATEGTENTSARLQEVEDEKIRDRLRKLGYE